MLTGNKKTIIGFSSLAVSVAVLLLKTKAYYVTNSVAVLSDALETVVNVITAVVALYAVKIASEPADENHPYGHGKFEYFSAAFEGGVVFFAGLAIIYQSAFSFFYKQNLQDLTTGNIYLIAASILNVVMGTTLLRMGRVENSEALQASGKHILSDVITTVAVIFGVFLSDLTGLTWIDSLTGLILGFWLTFESYKILRFNSGALLDEIDEKSVNELANIIKKHKNDFVVDIHNLRIIRSGNFHHIDAHLVVPEFLDIAKVHVIAHEFEQKVVKEYKNDGEFAFHVDPCKQAFCKACRLQNCNLRKVEFERDSVLNKEHLIQGPQYTN